MKNSDFGNYQCTLHLTSRTVIGVGHTPFEARKMALDCIESRNPDLAGFCAVMKTAPIQTERVGHDNRA